VAISGRRRARIDVLRDHKGWELGKADRPEPAAKREAWWLDGVAVQLAGLEVAQSVHQPDIVEVGVVRDLRVGDKATERLTGEGGVAVAVVE
jgi:hypothetical protein